MHPLSYLLLVDTNAAQYYHASLTQVKPRQGECLFLDKHRERSAKMEPTAEFLHTIRHSLPRTDPRRDFSFCRQENTGTHSSRLTTPPPQSFDHSPPQSFDHSPPQSFDHSPPQSFDHSPPQSFDHSPPQSFDHSPSLSRLTTPPLSRLTTPPSVV